VRERRVPRVQEALYVLGWLRSPLCPCDRMQAFRSRPVKRNDLIQTVRRVLGLGSVKSHQPEARCGEMVPVILQLPNGKSHFQYMYMYR
jgi:hypothetical protein